ncbi:hypothetical protein AMECASPLE_027366 [Ameca splendens]|uniref:Uncharacterized protein n=1 Tax=Ameca splendens TaxID=208324 RepID=A0ABV0Y576_9TELE
MRAVLRYPPLFPFGVGCAGGGSNALYFEKFQKSMYRSLVTKIHGCMVPTILFKVSQASCIPIPAPNLSDSNTLLCISQTFLLLPHHSHQEIPDPPCQASCDIM